MLYPECQGMQVLLLLLYCYPAVCMATADMLLFRIGGMQYGYTVDMLPLMS